MIRGDFREDIGIFARTCVPEIWFKERKNNLNMSLWAHTNTCTQNATLLPLICHLCAFQQKTFLQDRTGHWELWDLQGLCLHHLQVCGWMCPPCLNFCIFITRFTREHREHSACLAAPLCASRCHFESRQFWEFSFYGLVGLSFCSVWQHSRMQHFESGHSLHKHRCRFDHWTQL